MRVMSGSSPQLAGGVLIGSSVLSAVIFILWGVSIGRPMWRLSKCRLSLWSPSRSARRSIALGFARPNPKSVRSCRASLDRHRELVAPQGFGSGASGWLG